MYIYSIMHKTKRQQIIIDIVLSNHINSHDVLLSHLIEKGCDVTQATLSRDMKELKIVKTLDENGEYIYQPADRSRNSADSNLNNLSAYGFLSIEFSGSLAVIKTRPGYAMAIAGEIDQKATHTIIGTVAGDDTILLIPRENISRQAVIGSLAEFIPNI